MMVMRLNSKKNTLLPHGLTERLDVLGSVGQQQLLHLGVKVLPRLHQGAAVLAPTKRRVFLGSSFELLLLNLKRERKRFSSPISLLKFCLKKYIQACGSDPNF
jgi:hypothetical protein